jgi:hypothetical protein
MSRALLVAFLAFASLSAGQGEQTFTGTISDDMCATGTHAAMRMGPSDAECTVACVMAHGASYVLMSGRDVYKLSDQRAPEALAGQKVRVAGTLDARTNTITVRSIAADK